MRFKVPFLAMVVLLILSYATFAQDHTYFTHGGVVRTVAYSPVNSSLFASAGDNRAVKLWNLQNNTVTTLGHHTDTVNSIAFSADGQLLASGGDDYAFKLWDVPRKRHIATLDHINNRSRSQVKAVTFSPNGQLLATAGVEVKVMGYSHTRKEITYTPNTANGSWAVAFLCQMVRMLATGDAERT